MYDITDIKINKYSNKSTRGFVRITLNHNLTLNFVLSEGKNGFYLKPVEHKQNDDKYRSDFYPSSQLMQYFADAAIAEYNKVA